MSSPKVNDTPRSFSPHPMMSLSGSDLIRGGGEVVKWGEVALG